MIPEEHQPAVDACCDYIIHAAYSTMAEPHEMVAYIRERLRTEYVYPEVE
jgi:hypothetical protein